MSVIEQGDIWGGFSYTFLFFISLTLVYMADSDFNLVRIKVWGGLEVKTKLVCFEWIHESDNNLRQKYPRQQKSRITELRQKTHIPVDQFFRFIRTNFLTQYNLYREKVEIMCIK
jgi:hypothetical protein